MPAHATRIPEARLLTMQEHDLIRWLIEHGTGDVAVIRSQLESATVTARCSCGCASIDMAIEDAEEDVAGPMEIIADFAWKSETGSLCGAYLFTKHGQLAGLDLWSIDGAEIPVRLPSPESLFPFAQSPKG